MKQLLQTSSFLSASLVGGLFAAAALRAQEPIASAQVNELGHGTACEDVGESLDQCLAEAGLRPGWNAKTKTWCVTSSMPINPPDPKSDFPARRSAAFGQVETDVANQLATFLGAEIARQVQAHYVEGTELDLSCPGVARAADLIKSAASTTSTRKELAVSDTFVQAVSVISQQESAALQCFQCFESVLAGGQGGTVGAVFVLNRTSQSMQAALLGKDAAKQRAPGIPSSERVRRAFEAGELAATMGVLLHVNERGQVCLLSVAHATEQGARERGAKQKARTKALGYLRSFVGERVFLSAANTEGYSLQEYADLSRTLAVEAEFETYAKRVADGLNMQGVAPVLSKSYKHHASGERARVVVLEWTLDAATAANVLASRNKVMKGARGGKGTDGLFPPRRR